MTVISLMALLLFQISSISATFPRHQPEMGEPTKTRNDNDYKVMCVAAKLFSSIFSS